ncbi:hypothetical protein GCM10027517_30600 [Phycicoccus ginsengisoli]
MQGNAEADDEPREAVVVVDELMARRALRAARRHVLRRPHTWLAVCGAVGLLWLPTALAVVSGPGLGRGALVSSLAVLACVTALCPFVAVTMVRLHVGSEVARDLGPGQLVGVVVGRRTLRVRGHHCAHEVSYDLIRTIEEADGMVVVGLAGRYWFLPVELFDAASLAVLRQRVGPRRSSPTLLLA